MGGRRLRLGTSLGMMAPRSSTVESCAFCRIANGEDRSTEIICEGPSWVAFFPTEPATPGHTLIIPREHVADLWSMPTQLAADLMSASVKIGRAIRAAIAPPGMNLISSAGRVAEQTVFHAHIHIVPRYEGDDIDPIWPPKKRPDERLNEGIASKIRDACASV